MEHGGRTDADEANALREELRRSPEGSPPTPRARRMSTLLLLAVAFAVLGLAGLAGYYFAGPTGAVGAVLLFAVIGLIRAIPVLLAAGFRHSDRAKAARRVREQQRGVP